MFIVKGQVAINIDAVKIIRADEDLFAPKLVFDDAFAVNEKKPAQALEQILAEYERGAKVFRLKG